MSWLEVTVGEALMTPITWLTMVFAVWLAGTVFGVWVGRRR